MHKLLTGLRENLASQNEIILSLIALGRRETEALRTNNLPLLTELVGEQERAGEQLAKLEQQRTEFLQELAVSWDLPVTIKLREVLPFAGAEKDRLQEIASHLQTNVAALREVHATNRLLLQQSLSYVNSLLRVMLPEKEVVYNPAGRMQVQERTALLNKSV